MPDFNIRVVIDPDTRGVQQVDRQLNQLQRTGTNVGRRIAAAIATALAGLSGAGALRSFSSIEQGLIGVAKTTDLTTEEMAALRQEVLETSRQLPFARTELLSIAQAAGQLGVRGVENLAKFSSTIAQLGVASDLSGEAAATALTRILTVTNEGTENVDKFASVIVALGNQFAATESEIASTATSVAAAGAVFGISAGESAALAASFRSVGVEAQVSGTTVGKSMQVVEAALRKGGDEMRLLQEVTGQTREELRRAFEEDAAGVFQSFLEGLGRIQEAGGSVNAVLEDLGLADQRILRSLGALAQNSQLVARAFAVQNAEMENATALAEEVARNQNSVETQYILTRNAVMEVVEAVGESLAPAFIEAATAVREFIVEAQEGETLPAIYDAITTATLGLNDAFGLLTENMDLVATALGLIAARQLGLLASSEAVTGAMSVIRREILLVGDAYHVLGARAGAAAVAQRAFVATAGLARRAVSGLAAAFGGPLGLTVAIGLVANQFGLFESKASALTRITDSVKTKVGELTGEFDDQAQSVGDLITKYEELGRAQLAQEIIEAQSEVRSLESEMAQLRAEVDENIVSQLIYLESVGKTGAEAGAASREAVDSYQRMKAEGKDVTDVVLEIVDRLKEMGELDVASNLIAGFNAITEAQDAVASGQERLNALLSVQAGLNVPQTEAFVPLPINAPKDEETETPTTPTIPTTGGGGGPTFGDIVRDLERENELLNLGIRAREERAEILRVEEALERKLTDAQRAQIEALVAERQAIEDANFIQDIIADYEREIEALGLTERERDIRIEQLQLEEQLARPLTEAEAGLIEGYARERQAMEDLAAARDEFLGGFDELAAQRQALVALFEEGSISADQLEQSLREVQVRAAELRIELGEGDFADGFVSSLFRMTEAAQDFTAEAGGIFAQFTANLASGFGDAISGMIQGTKSLSESLKEVARNAITQLISALIQLGVQWVIQQALALALGSAATSAVAGQATALAAAWATPAALASLASYGANAGPALAAIAGTIAATQGLAAASGGLSSIAGGGGGAIAAFQSGGEVEAAPAPGGGLLARVSAGEFLVNSEATRKNAVLLERMNAGEPLSAIVADLGSVSPEGPRRAASRRRDEGGAIRGPGTGTSDSILTTLPGGSFVVRESVARRYGPVLERINRGDDVSEIAREFLPPEERAGETGAIVAAAGVPGFARGGLIVEGPSGRDRDRTQELLFGSASQRRTDSILRRPAGPSAPTSAPRAEAGGRGDTFQVTFAPVFETRDAVDRYRETEAQSLAQFGRAVDEVARRRRSVRGGRF